MSFFYKILRVDVKARANDLPRGWGRGWRSGRAQRRAGVAAGNVVNAKNPSTLKVRMRQGKKASRGSLNSSWNQNCSPPFYILFLYFLFSLFNSLFSSSLLPFGICVLCGESVEGLRCHWQQTGSALPLLVFSLNFIIIIILCVYLHV